MKLRFQKDDIVNGISIVMKAVPSKTTMSILECILIDASSGEIKLTGNDMELGIETTVNGEILEHGKIALDAKLFSEITRRVSSQNAVVTIESDDKFNTTISCENSVFNIQGRDGEEFSYIPYIEKNKYISLSQFTLKEVIQQTIFSISPNDSNKMMAGELFEVNEDAETNSVVAFLTNKYVATLITLAGGYLLSLGGYLNIWPLFGSANQLLAAMVLVSLSVFLKVTGRKGYMLYVPMVMMLVVTMTSLGMSVYNICLKLFVTGGFVFMTDGLQLFFAILLMALGLMIFIGSGKKLVQPVEKAMLQEQEQNA